MLEKYENQLPAEKFAEPTGVDTSEKSGLSTSEKTSLATSETRRVMLERQGIAGSRRRLREELQRELEPRNNSGISRKPSPKEVLRHPRLRYIPWSGLMMVFGMWVGTLYGQRYDAANYLIYSSFGMGLGLLIGYMLDRSAKSDKVQKTQKKRPTPDRTRPRNRRDS